MNNLSITKQFISPSADIDQFSIAHFSKVYKQDSNQAYQIALDLFSNDGCGVQKTAVLNFFLENDHKIVLIFLKNIVETATSEGGRIAQAAYKKLVLSRSKAAEELYNFCIKKALCTNEKQQFYASLVKKFLVINQICTQFISSEKKTDVDSIAKIKSQLAITTQVSPIKNGKITAKAQQVVQLKSIPLDEQNFQWQMDEFLRHYSKGSNQALEYASNWIDKKSDLVLDRLKIFFYYIIVPKDRRFALKLAKMWIEQTAASTNITGQNLCNELTLFSEDMKQFETLFEKDKKEGCQLAASWLQKEEPNLPFLEALLENLIETDFDESGGILASCCIEEIKNRSKTTKLSKSMEKFYGKAGFLQQIAPLIKTFRNDREKAFKTCAALIKKKEKKVDVVRYNAIVGKFFVMLFTQDAKAEFQTKESLELVRRCMEKEGTNETIELFVKIYNTLLNKKGSFANEMFQICEEQKMKHIYSESPYHDKLFDRLDKIKEAHTNRIHKRAKIEKN